MWKKNMGPKVSEEHKERVRDAILLAAQWVFSKKGFNETTMDDIVEESKLSKGTLYNYFQTKEELYSAYIKKYQATFKQGLEMRMKQFSTYKEKLENVMKFYFLAQTLKPRELIQSDIENWAISLKSDFLRKFARDEFLFHTELLGNIIRDGINTGEFKSNIDIELNVGCFMATINGSVVGQAFKEDTLDWIKLGDLIIPMYLKGFLIK